MMRQVSALLLVLALSCAVMDQSYIQVVDRDGSSTIQKTMDISLYTGQLPAVSLQRMADYCAGTTKISCSVDVDSGKVAIIEKFQPGGYYSFESAYGIPFTTRTLVVGSIPNDRFGQSLAAILAGANITTGQETGAADALDLRDKTNPESAMYLEKFRANLTYSIVMPSDISGADAGNYTAATDGSTATFDLVQVLERSSAMTVASREINSPAIVVIAGVIVVAGLALAFFTSKPRHAAKRRKK
jgi:hypothetical protein